MKRENKGITLVALVITIIVLLILAGITINLTVGQQGILTRAQVAGRNYEEAAKREDEQLTNFLKEADDIIESITPKISETVKKLKAGDYIKYDSGENGIITCRVLYPVDSEYGLQIISDKNVKEVTLGKSGAWEDGRIAYNNAIEDLNNEAEKYVNPEYAYDGRCVGSIPTVQDGMFVDKDKFKDSNGNTPGYEKVPEGWETVWPDGHLGCYGSDSNRGVDVRAMTQAEILNTGESYWFASRYTSKSVYFGFHVWRKVEWNGESTGFALCYARNDGGGLAQVATYGIRPCISLKSVLIKITAGDGTSAETAYIIESK